MVAEKGQGYTYLDRENFRMGAHTSDNALRVSGLAGKRQIISGKFW